MILKRESLNEKVYEAIKGKVITSEFPPRYRLQEEQLVNMFGTSKTPIKIALAKLEKEGLVQTIPCRGTYVIELTVQMMSEIYSLREMLEGLAARLASQNLSASDLEEMRDNLSKFDPANSDLSLRHYLDLDSTFHMTILQGARNRYLEEALQLLYDKINMSKLKAASERQKSGEPYREHLEILKAIEARDPALAESAMRFHIQQVMKSLMMKSSMSC